MNTGLAAASGLSATMLLTHLLKSGEHILCVDDVYGGNYSLYCPFWSQIETGDEFLNFSFNQKLGSIIRKITLKLVHVPSLWFCY